MSCWLLQHNFTFPRSRHYLNPASSADCGEELIQSTQCRGNHADCPTQNERDHSPSVTGLGYGHGSYGGNTVSPSVRIIKMEI